MYQPYDLKEPPIYHSFFNHFYHYTYHNNVQPLYFECKIPNKKSVLDKLLQEGAQRIFIDEYESKNDNKIKTTEIEIVLEYKDALISFCCPYNRNSYNYNSTFSDFDDNENAKKTNNFYIKILYREQQTLDFIRGLFDYAKEKEKKNVYLLCRIDGELIAQRFNIKLPQEKLDLELNYGKEILEKEKLLIKNLEDNKSGLVLFNGPPGTGKSTFIKYISTKTKRKIIYLPSSSASEITDPGFLTFITQHKNSILLLEDAEKVLRSREIQDNNAISNILNLTDGLLGDCLNIFIIATFNTDRDQIDPALLRKGRLALEHEFNKLPIENCNRIFESLKSDRKTDIPLSLAEIYNDANNFTKKEQKNKIGF